MALKLMPSIWPALRLTLRFCRAEAGQTGRKVIDPWLDIDLFSFQAGLHGSDRQVKIEDRDVRVGGDVITAFNGQPVTGFDDLVSDLAGSGRCQC